MNHSPSSSLGRCQVWVGHDFLGSESDLRVLLQHLFAARQQISARWVKKLLLDQFPDLSDVHRCSQPATKLWPGPTNLGLRMCAAHFAQVSAYWLNSEEAKP